MINTFLRIGDRLQPLAAPVGMNYWIADAKPTSDALTYITYKLAVDSGLNTYALGYTFVDGGSTGTGVTIVKYNSLGVVQWSVETGSITENTPKSIEVAANGDILVMYTGESVNRTNSVTIIRMSNSGTVIWKKEIISGGTDYDVGTTGHDMSTTLTNDIYVISLRTATTLDPTPNQLLVISKLSSTGTLTWMKTFTTTAGLMDIAKIKADSSGGAYGMVQINSVGLILFYINSSGTIQWSKGFSGLTHGANYCPSRMAVDSSDDLYVAYSSTVGLGVLKMSQAGVTLKQKDIGRTSSADVIFEVTFDPTSQQVYVMTWTYAGVGILRYTTNLEYVWQRVSSGIPGYYGSSLVTDINGDLYFLGWLNESSIIKVASNGALVGDHVGPNGSFSYMPMILPTNDVVYNEQVATLTPITGVTINLVSSVSVCEIGPINSSTILGQVYPVMFLSPRKSVVSPLNTLFAVGEVDQYNVGVIKYTTTRTVEWQRKYTKTGYHVTMKAIVTDSSSNLIIAGSHTSTTTGLGAPDPWIMKVGTDGTVIWSKSIDAVISYSDGGTGTFTGVTVSPDGSIIAVGELTYLTSTLSKNMLVVKFTSAGAVVWKKYITRDMSTSTDVVCNSSNDIYISGTTSGNGLGAQQNCLIAKINSSGTLLWSQHLTNSQQHTNTTNTSLDSSGNVYFASIGQNVSTFSPSPYNIALTKLNSSGVIQWVQKVTSTNKIASFSPSIAINSSDNIIYATDGTVTYFNTNGVTQQSKRIYGSHYDLSISSSSILLIGLAASVHEYNNSTISSLGSADVSFTNGSWTVDTSVTFALSDLTASVVDVTLVTTSATYAQSIKNIPNGCQYTKVVMT